MKGNYPALQTNFWSGAKTYGRSARGNKREFRFANKMRIISLFHGELVNTYNYFKEPT